MRKSGNIRRTALLLLAAALLCLTLAGCWDKEEIADLVFLAGIGVDVPLKGEGVSVTAELIKISSGKDDAIQSTVFASTGKNIADALVGLACHVGGKLNFNYCEVVVLGEEYAKSGLGDVVDVVLRNNDIQHTTLLAVAKDCRASEVFAAKSADEPVAAYELSGIIKANYSRCLRVTKNDAYAIRGRLEKPGGGLALTQIYLERDGDAPSLMAGGAAVFGDAGLAGWLTPEETAYFRMATGQAVSGVEAAPGPDGGYFTAELRNFETRSSALLDGGGASLELDIRTEATLIEPAADGTVPLPWSPDEVGESFAKAIRDGVSGLVTRAQIEFGCDLFGFGGTFEKADGRAWRQTREDWPRLFREMDVTVDASVRIVNAGMSKSDMEER